jgi:NTP pyrophosphatase (non-canonical NTP hydrolase)
MNLKLNEAANEIHQAAKEKGFWDNPRETGTLLMLCVSELAEAMEADRKDRFAYLDDDMREDLDDPKDTSPRYCIRAFENQIKDTFEDELADTVIRILDLCGARGIDLEWHIEQKLKYNKTRDRMHGKRY